MTSEVMKILVYLEYEWLDIKKIEEMIKKEDSISSREHMYLIFKAFERFF